MSKPLWIAKFREFLLTKKMSLTREREAVAAAIYESQHLFDADQWIDSLAGRPGSMLASRSTVYRTLYLLEEAGLIRKVLGPTGRDVYELIDEDPSSELPSAG